MFARLFAKTSLKKNIRAILPVRHRPVSRSFFISATESKFLTPRNTRENFLVEAGIQFGRKTKNMPAEEAKKEYQSLPLILQTTREKALFNLGVDIGMNLAMTQNPTEEDFALQCMRSHPYSIS